MGVVGRTRSAVLVVLASCGRAHFDPTVDAGPVPPCNAITRFGDDFADGVLDSRWSYSYGTFMEVGGEVVFPLVPNMTTYAGYVASRYYDLRGSRMSIALAQAPGFNATAGFSATYDPNTGVRMILKNDTLVGVRSATNVYEFEGQLPYDPVAHRYWAIEEHDGRIAYEVSPDGIKYTTFAEVDDPFDFSLVQPQFFAGTDNPDPAPGEAHFADYNGGKSAPIDACAVGTLVDPLDGSVSDHVWAGSYADPCCTYSELTGQLRFTTNGAMGYVGRHSSAGFDLREGAIEVTLVTPPAGPMFGIALNASHDPQNQLDMRVATGTVIAVVIVNNSGTTASSPLQAGEKYMRIRETGGNATFEISADMQTWRTIRQLPDPFPLDDLTVGLDGGANAAGPLDMATFADFDGP
jgi:hypothetical protein